MKNNKAKQEKMDRIKEKIVPMLKKNKVTRAGIFGSYARGHQNKNSDIDILVEINDKKFSLLDLVKLKISLQKILNKEVDLVEYSTIHPLIKKQALKEEIKLI